jgi:hypothetical protein
MKPLRDGTSWLWTLDFGHHEDRTSTHGYEPTREVRFRAQTVKHLLVLSLTGSYPSGHSEAFTRLAYRP